MVDKIRDQYNLKINKKHGFILVAVVVFVSAVLIYLLRFQEKGHPEADNEQAALVRLVEKTVDDIENIHADDPKNWSRYQERKFGVRFHYPSYYQIHRQPDFMAAKIKEHEVWVTFAHFNDEFVPRVMFIISKLPIEGVFEKFSRTMKGEPMIEKKLNYTQCRVTNMAGDKIMHTVVMDDGETRFIFIGSEKEVIDKMISTFEVE